MHKILPQFIFLVRNTLYSVNKAGVLDVYCKHIVSRYPVANLKFQIVSLPEKAPQTKYGQWKVKSSKISKKCYQTSWNKHVFDLCVKVKEVCLKSIFVTECLIC